MGIFQIAAVLIHHEQTNQILLINHNKLPYKDWWAFPGGKIEPHETLEQAARREVIEETGIQIENPDIISILNERVLKEGDFLHHFLIIYFVGKSPTLEIKNNSHREGQLKWYSADKLPERFVPSDKKILEQFKKGLSGNSTFEGVLLYSRDDEEVDLNLIDWFEY